MIHRYLRSVGFSEYTDRNKINAMMADVLTSPSHAAMYEDPKAGELHAVFDETKPEEKRRFGIITKEFSPNTGVAVCGEYDVHRTFLFDYYFPFLESNTISTAEEITVERHTFQDSYVGVVDDSRVGISLIFYLINSLEYAKRAAKNSSCLKNATLSLSALSDKAVILMPIAKTERDREVSKKIAYKRYKMISKAKRGSESAIESLTLQEMDTYTAVQKKIQGSDIFSLVESYFMPHGIECDHYSVLGEIISCQKYENNMTKETIYVMKIVCNDLVFGVCINEKDLQGEPKEGRRFRGNIWMQGKINFADTIAAG